MAEVDPLSSTGEAGLQGKSTRDRLFRAAWIYLRGWVLIVLLFLAVTAGKKAYSRVAEVLEPVSGWTNSAASSKVLTIIILIVVPWVVGKVVELFLTGRLFQQQRGVRALQQMERRLSTELKADRHRGYRVALVNWPTATVQSLGLIVAEFNEPVTGRELFAVYLPNTPDPTRGAMRVMAREEVTMTDWDLSDLTRFHITFGTASPDLEDRADPAPTPEVTEER